MMAFDQSSLYSYIEYIAAPGRKLKAESTNSPFSPKRSRKTLQFLLHIFHLTPVKYFYSIGSHRNAFRQFLRREITQPQRGVWEEHCFQEYLADGGWLSGTSRSWKSDNNSRWTMILQLENCTKMIFLYPCKALGAIESLQIETEVFWTLKYKQDWTRQDDIKAIIIIQ